MNLSDIVKKESLRAGKRGKTYILENDNVFKQFNEPLSVVDIKLFEYFLEYSNESFLFPFDFVYDEDQFYGYISKKSLGQNLEDIFISTNLEKLSTHSVKLEKNINYISEGKILMNDFHSENIMYDENLFEVVDPDDYEIKQIYSIKEIKKENLKKHRHMISNLFIFNIPFNKYTKYIIKRIGLYKYSSYKVSEIIIAIKEDIRKHYKEEIGTLEDFNKVIRR